MKLSEKTAKIIQGIAKASTKKAVGKCLFPGIYELEPSDEIIKWTKRCSDNVQEESWNH